MKNLFFMVGVIITIISATSADTKLEYKDGYYISKSKLNALPNRTERKTTTLNSVKITAPADGYIVVTSSGKGCIHTNREFIELILSDKHSRTLSSNSFGWAGEGRACTIGEVKSYSFRHVETVKAGTTRTYKILGQRGSKRAISGNIYMGALMAVFYAKENQKYGSNNEDIKRTILADGSVQLSYPDGKIITKSNSGTVIIYPNGQTEKKVKIIPYSHVPFSTLPEEPATLAEKMWINKHANNLLNIIRTQIDNQETLNSYTALEEKDKLSMFNKIDRRSKIINYLLSP